MSEAVSDQDLFKRVNKLVERVSFRFNKKYQFSVGHDRQVFFEILNIRPDSITGKTAIGGGGRRYVRADMTDGQIYRGMLGACLAYEEHEVREAFMVDGRAIFGPHITIEALLEAANQVDRMNNGN